MTRINQPYTNFTAPSPNVYDLSLGAVLGPKPRYYGIAERALDEQRKENALLRKLIDELRADARSEARRLAAERDASMRHAKTITGLRADAIASQKTIADLRAKLYEKNVHIDQQAKRIANLQETRKRLIGTRDHLWGENDTLRSQASDRRVEAVGLRNQLREQGKRCASAGESQSYVMLCQERQYAANLRKTNEGLRNAMASKHKRLQEANSLITSLREKLEALADLNDVYYKRLNELQKVNTTPDCSTEVASLKRDLASRDCVIQDAAKRVRWLEMCQTNQAETIAEQRAEVSLKDGVVKRLGDDLRIVRKANAELLAERAAGLNASATTERRTLQQVINRMRRDGDHLIKVIRQRNTEIKDMKRRVQLLDALVAERDGTIQDRRKKIQATQDEVVALNRTVKNLKYQLIEQGLVLNTKNRQLDLQESTQDEVVALNRTVKDLKRLLSTKDKTIADRETRRRMLCGEIAIYKKDRDIARRDAYDFRVARDKAQSALAVEVRVTSHLGDMVEAFSMALDSQSAEEDRKLEAEWYMTTTSRREQ